MIPLESDNKDAILSSDVKPSDSVVEPQNPTTPSETLPAASPGPKKSLKEFAQLIKSKYPQTYDDLEDDDLAKKVIRKYPQYHDMVDLTPLTQSIRENTLSNFELKSNFQSQLDTALLPTQGKLQVGKSAFERNSDDVAIPLETFKGLDLRKSSNMEFANAVTQATWGIPIGQLTDLYAQAGLPTPDLDHLEKVGAIAKQNLAYAQANKQPHVVVGQKGSTVLLRKAMVEGGIAGFNAMAKELSGEQQRVDESLHDVTPEERQRIIEARHAVSFKLGLAQATIGQNEFWTNLLSLPAYGDPSGRLRKSIQELNIIPGAEGAKEVLAQASPQLPSFYHDQSNFDAFIEVVPGTVLQTTRMLAAAAAGSASVGATQLGPAIGSIVGMQADTGIQNFDKPLTVQAQNQLITLAMSGAGVSAGVARHILKINGVNIPNILYIPTESAMMGIGTYGAMEIMSPEATFQQKLANSITGALLPLGFAAARGLTPKAKPIPEVVPPRQLGPAPEGGLPLLPESFPIYENKYPSEYKVNLSKPGEPPIELGYKPGEQIPLFDAVIGGQNARSHMAKGLSGLSDGELQEAYIQAGGADHSLPTDRAELISTIMDLHSSKFPLMEATTENKMPVIEKWAGITRQDQLMETPFQFGKTYRILEDGPGYWKVEDLDNPGHRYRIGKYEPAGLAANIETVTTTTHQVLERTLVVPDFSGPKLETQPLLFTEPQAGVKAGATEPPTATTDRQGAIKRLELLNSYKKGEEYKAISGEAKKQINDEISQLRKDILTPSGGRNQLFVPRPAAENHLQNLINYTKRPEFAELDPQYQQLVKQEIADLDFLLNKNQATPEDVERQASIYKGITDTTTNSPENKVNPTVNQTRGQRIPSRGVSPYDPNAPKVEAPQAQTQPPETTAPVEEAQAPVAPSAEAQATVLPSDGTIPINQSTNLFGVRALLREMLARRQQREQIKQQLGNVAGVRVPDPENNPLWQMISQLPSEELIAQLQEQGIDTGLLKSKALQQKALYSQLAPESEAPPVASPEQQAKFQNLQAGITPEMEKVAATEKAMLEKFPETPDEPSWITKARENLKKTTLSALGGQTLYDLALVHAYDHIYKPGMRYAKFAKEVIEQLGEEYSPYINSLWDHFTSQATQRVSSLGQAMAGVKAKLALRDRSVSDLAKQSPEALRAYYDALGLTPKDSLPMRGVVSPEIESQQLASDLSNILSGMKKLGARTPEEAHQKLASLEPDLQTLKTMNLTPAEMLSIKQAEVTKPPVVSFDALDSEQLVDAKVEDLVKAVDKLMVNNRAAEKLAGVKDQQAQAKLEVPVYNDKVLQPEDWLRGLDISPEELTARVEKITKANRFVSTETYLQAKADLKASGILNTNQTNALVGITPKQLRAMSVVLAYHVENGIYNFGKAFSEKATELFGDTARANMYELAEDTFRYLRLYRQSPILNKLSQLPGGFQLGKVMDWSHKVAFGGVDAFRKAFSLGSRSPQAREIGDLWAFKQAEIARATDTMKQQLGVVRDWAEGFVYSKTGNPLNPLSYAKSELNSKKLRMDMNFALDEGTDQQFLNQIKAPAEIKVLINEMKTALGNMRAEIQKVSPNALQEVIENYFPRLWKRPGETGTGESPTGGAPLTGSKSFLRERSLDSTRYGVEKLGWKLKNENFVDNFITKYEEMQKFVKMNEVLQHMKKNNMEKVVDRSQLGEIKEFYKPLEDSVSNIHDRIEKANGDVTYSDSGKVRVYPAMVADLINSHLAPSLHRFPIFQAWNSFSNFANQFQLVGYFHAALVSADAVARLPGLAAKGMLFDAWQHLYHNEPQAAMAVLKESAKALATGIFPPAGVASVVWKGNQMLKEWNSPGSQSPDIQQRVKFAQLGGAQAKMEGHFQGKAIEGLLKNIQNTVELMASTDPDVNKVFGTAKQVALGAAKLPFAAIEVIMRPMLEQFVPRAKLGVQYYLQGYEISRLGARANAKEVRRTSAKVEAVVSDTLGQMNYGNLHMNKVVKESIMSVVRATGFQFGAQRTAYMPALDTINFAKDLVTPGEKAEFTHRMAYLVGMGIGLPIMHGLAQAISTYYNTGKAEMLGDKDGKFDSEQAIKDSVAFRTGRLDQNGDPERWYVPNLGTKEIYPVGSRILEGRPGAALQHQLEIFGHKLNPGPALIGDLYSNKDFNGRAIFDPNSTKSSLAQAGDYTLSQLTPFFVKNKDILEQRGVNGLARFATFFGPTPAPQYINASTAEDVMMDMMKESYPKTPKGSDEYERGKQKRKYLNQWKQANLLGDQTVLDVLSDEIDGLVEKGTLTTADRKAIYKGVDKDRTTDLFSRLAQQRPLDALRVFESWMSPQEQTLVLPEIAKLYRKVNKLALSPGKKQELYDRIDNILETKNASIEQLLDEKSEEEPNPPSPTPIP